ncbi:MAG: hypothetical protein WBX25_36545, partial [Rhodomicrobium sp.]
SFALALVQRVSTRCALTEPRPRRPMHHIHPWTGYIPTHFSVAYVGRALATLDRMQRDRDRVSD